MRDILAAYEGCHPSELEFTRTCTMCGHSAHGKPVLRWPREQALRFNLSHSGDLAVLGVTGAPAIGVDIEMLQTGHDVASMAAQFLSPEEKAWFASVPDDAKDHAFARCWTAKEAFLKALGEGLSGDLKRFTVRPLARALSLEIAGDPTVSARWSVLPLAFTPRAVGAVAVGKPHGPLRVRRFAASRVPNDLAMCARSPH
jgi:4'-phosphopantetheinyl transferase